MKQYIAENKMTERNMNTWLTLLFQSFQSQDVPENEELHAQEMVAYRASELQVSFDALELKSKDTLLEIQRKVDARQEIINELLGLQKIAQDENKTGAQKVKAIFATIHPDHPVLQEKEGGNQMEDLK